MKLSVFKTLAVLSLAAASTAAATEVDRTFNKRFDVQPGARLEIEHGDGRVEVAPWAEDAIEVEVRYKVESKRVGVGRDPDLEVRFEQRGKVVRVIGEEQSFGGVGFFSINEIEYVYRVKAPAYVELDLEGEDGNVEISDWRGAIRLKNEDGDVRLKNVHAVDLDVEDGDVDIEGSEGDLELELDDGDVTWRDCRGGRARIDVEDGQVRLERCRGSFVISTDDGDVELNGMIVARLDVRSEDGSVEVEVVEAVGELDLGISTDDGDVALLLGEGVSGAYTLSASDGGIEVDAPAGGVEKNRRRASGKLGDGSGKIRVSTQGGRIRMRQSSG